jgi:hypothetical protein
LQVVEADQLHVPARAVICVAVVVFVSRKSSCSKDEQTCKPGEKNALHQKSRHHDFPP